MSFHQLSDEFEIREQLPEITSKANSLAANLPDQLREILEKVLEDGSKRPEAYLEGFPAFQEGE